jgi:hypothetical protein
MQTFPQSTSSQILRFRLQAGQGRWALLEVVISLETVAETAISREATEGILIPVVAIPTGIIMAAVIPMGIITTVAIPTETTEGAIAAILMGTIPAEAIPTAIIMATDRVTLVLGLHMELETATAVPVDSVLTTTTEDLVSRITDLAEDSEEDLVRAASAEELAVSESLLLQKRLLSGRPSVIIPTAGRKRITNRKILGNQEEKTVIPVLSSTGERKLILFQMLFLSQLIFSRTLL